MKERHIYKKKIMYEAVMSYLRIIKFYFDFIVFSVDLLFSNIFRESSTA